MKRAPKAASPPPFFSSDSPLQAKRKSCPSCQSSLKLLFAPSSPCERKPKARPCAKDDTPRDKTSTTPCNANPNAHTTHATSHATSPCPRLPCLASARPRAHRPPEAASPPTRLRLSAFPAPPLHPALACFPSCPRRTRHSPASGAQQGRGGKLRHPRRLRRASAPDIPVAPAFPGACAGFEVLRGQPRHLPASAPPQTLTHLPLRPRRIHHPPASSARRGRGGNKGTPPRRHGKAEAGAWGVRLGRGRAVSEAAGNKKAARGGPRAAIAGAVSRVLFPCGRQSFN